ncbi:hypothetical protein AHF37_00502 [Paragonimus kellicotti]|nr:hypothetical protein AHF37_00502 [Paragonimus kellicotti]
MLEPEKTLLRFCILIRLLQLLLQIVLSLFPDHNADAFDPPISISSNLLDSSLYSVLRGYRRWDSIYFCFISRWGYLYEKCLAFFPLFPATLGLISRFVYPLTGHLVSLDTLILLVGICVNQFCGVLSTIQLYRLGLQVLGSPGISYFAALLFCINPALIFFSSVYSESLFFLLTLTALRCYEHGRLLLATVLFATTIGCRSNGLLNLGYIIYNLWSSPVLASLLWNEKTILSAKRSLFFMLYSCVRWWCTFFGMIVPYGLLCLMAVVPFLLYQLYAYYLYCPNTHLLPFLCTWMPNPTDMITQYGFQLAYNMPMCIASNTSLINSKPAWCSSNLPFSYSYIQDTFWNVHFLGYFEWKQLPNFILAMPVVLLSLSCASSFYARAPNAYRTLGLRTESAKDRQLVPYIFHVLLLTVYGITHINVQVLTRIIFSSCPVIYWYCGYLMCESPQRHTKQTADKSKMKGTFLVHSKNEFNYRLAQVAHLLNPAYYHTVTQRLILVYFLGYAIVGSVLHSKFLPWT